MIQSKIQKKSQEQLPSDSNIKTGLTTLIRLLEIEKQSKATKNNKGKNATENKKERGRGKKEDRR